MAPPWLVTWHCHASQYQPHQFQVSPNSIPGSFQTPMMTPSTYFPVCGTPWHTLLSSGLLSMYTDTGTVLGNHSHTLNNSMFRWTPLPMTIVAYVSNLHPRSPKLLSIKTIGVYGIARPKSRPPHIATTLYNLITQPAIRSYWTQPHSLQPVP